MNIPGLSKADLKDTRMNLVEADSNLQLILLDQLIKINKGDGYPKPDDSWLGGSITTDLLN